MKQQVVVIHGGTTFENYEEYINYLKNKDLNLEKIRPQKFWNDSLQEELGENFDVLLPRMPNGSYARYEEWKIWFERILSLLDDNPIFVGHSLGGIFLAKYFSENPISFKVKSTILVAAPFDDENSDESLSDFRLPSSLAKFVSQGGEICLIQSKDDPVVPFEQLAKYEQVIPKAKTLIFEDRQHFKQERFPELVELIKKIHEV